MLQHASLLLLFLVPSTVRPAQEEPDRAALEQAFAETMSGAVLVGHFTDDSAPPGAAPSEDRYTLGPVAKVEGDRWRFEAQVDYGGRSFPVALELDVAWAGDTPVITMTDRKIPLVGTFTVRLLVYRDRYAGTWSGADHGGHMWGRIERAAKEPAGGEGGGEGDGG